MLGAGTTGAGVVRSTLVGVVVVVVVLLAMNIFIKNQITPMATAAMIIIVTGLVAERSGIRAMNTPSVG